MTQAHSLSVSFLLLAGGAHAASQPATPPPQQAEPVAAVQVAAGQYQCLDPSRQLHSLLSKYALKCGNPACPLCYPAGPQP